MLHTDRLPFGVYYAECEDEEPDYDEPQPTIYWRFKDEQGYEDVALPDEFASMYRTYCIECGGDFTVELEYTEPEDT